MAKSDDLEEQARKAKEAADSLEDAADKQRAAEDESSGFLGL
jgi:hypothetical protein